VSRDEEDYSDYSRHINTTINGLTVMMGFTFTVITLLLTRLGNLHSLGSQLILLFLVILFYLDGFLAEHLGVETLYHCKRVPPQTRKIALRTVLMFLSYSLLGLVIPFMFLLFDLVLLSVVAGIVWLIAGLADLVVVYKPLWEYRRKNVR
jgi:hypothetical protein